MELIMTVLAEKQQSFVGPISRAGMSTLGTGLTTVVGIDLDGHTLLQEGFINNHAVQLGKAPLGIGGIGLALLWGDWLVAFPLLLALNCSSLRAFPNMGQVFQPDQAVGMLLGNAFTHDMVGVLLQPSLPSADLNQSSGRRTGAFALKTLFEPCVVVGLGDDLFTRIEGASVADGTGHMHVPHKREVRNHEYNEGEIAHSLDSAVAEWHLADIAQSSGIGRFNTHPWHPE
jgi:hypothetical protein